MIGEILLQVEECKQKCQFYQEHGKQFRTKHLNEHLHLAEEIGVKVAMEKFATIIQQEKATFILALANLLCGEEMHLERYLHSGPHTIRIVT